MNVVVHGRSKVQVAVYLGMLWGFIPKDRWPQAIPVLKSLLEALGHSDVSTTIELLSGQDS